MEQSVRARSPSRLRTLRNWALLLVMLFLVDDLVLGPVFWFAAQFDLVLAGIAAFFVYWIGGSLITIGGLKPNPGRFTKKALSWFQLEHKDKPELYKLEQDLHNKITSVATAVPMTLLFGGVFTTLWLRRRGIVSTAKSRRLAIWLCGLYALEPTAIHVFGIGWLILFVRHALGF